MIKDRKQHFKDNPKVRELHFTSDGSSFAELHHAESHAAFLKRKGEKDTIEAVTREAVLAETEPGNSAEETESEKQSESGEPSAKTGSGEQSGSGEPSAKTESEAAPVVKKPSASVIKGKITRLQKQLDAAEEQKADSETISALRGQLDAAYAELDSL